MGTRAPYYSWYLRGTPFAGIDVSPIVTWIALLISSAFFVLSNDLLTVYAPASISSIQLDGITYTTVDLVEGAPGLAALVEVEDHRTTF